LTSEALSPLLAAWQLKASHTAVGLLLAGQPIPTHSEVTRALGVELHVLTASDHQPVAALEAALAAGVLLRFSANTTPLTPGTSRGDTSIWLESYTPEPQEKGVPSASPKKVCQSFAGAPKP
jgi:hypothetical protein